MALRIFETDPEAMPKPKVSFDDGTIGRFHSGKMVGKAPVSLDHWEISTGDADVSNALAELFRAPVVDTGSDQENFLRIEETGTDSVDIILESLTSDMKQWLNGKLAHHCDGVEFLSVDPAMNPSGVVGAPCGCPRFFKERKDAAKAMRGPAPSIKLIFRLADAPELGTFSFQSTSWTMAEVLHEYDAALSHTGYPAVAELALEFVQYTTKAGRNVEYRKPVLNRIRSYDDANAE